eukprot:Gb_06436 [translate_table: standard]
MATSGYSPAPWKQCSSSAWAVLKHNPSESFSPGVRHFPFLLLHHPHKCRTSTGLIQNYYPLPRLKASSSRENNWAVLDIWPSRKIALQKGLQDRAMGIVMHATAEDSGQAGSENAEEELRRREESSSLPPQLRKLTKEVPDPPNLLPWLAGFAILLITREVVVSELVRWVKAAGFGLKLLLNLALGAFYLLLNPFVKPIAAIITGAAWAFLIVKEVYAFIIDMTPVGGLIEAIVLSSAVLAIGEAIRENAVRSQQYTLGMAAFLGLGAVLGLFPPSVFVVLLFALFVFSLLVRKRDIVSSVMPVSAVLAAVAEPWVRGVVIASFLALAVYKNWKSPEKEKVAVNTNAGYGGQPLIMFLASLMVGLSVAAQWLYFRQLIWLAK